MAAGPATEPVNPCASAAAAAADTDADVALFPVWCFRPDPVCDAAGEPRRPAQAPRSCVRRHWGPEAACAGPRVDVCAAAGEEILGALTAMDRILNAHGQGQGPQFLSRVWSCGGRQQSVSGSRRRALIYP